MARPDRVRFKLTHLSRKDSSTAFWNGSFQIEGVSFMFLLVPYFIEIPAPNVNSVDSDQTPRSAASDLGLHCLPKSLLGEARHKWANTFLTSPRSVPRNATSSVSTIVTVRAVKPKSWLRKTGSWIKLRSPITLKNDSRFNALHR